MVQRRFVLPNKPLDFTAFARKLREANDVKQARQLQAELRAMACDGNTFLGNHIVHAYGRLGCPLDASLAFQRIRNPNDYSWSMLLFAFCRNGKLSEAKEVFAGLARKNVVTWTAMISADPSQALLLFRRMQLEGVRPDAAAFLALMEGFEECSGSGLGTVHNQIVESGLGKDVFVGSTLVNLYGKLGEVERAKQVFDELRPHSVVSWTALLSAYAHKGHLLEAKFVFSRMPQRDTVAWNSLISAHQAFGLAAEALEIFKVMDQQGLRPEQGTFTSVLDACSTLASLEDGKQVHRILDKHPNLRSDPMIQNALIDMYGKCGDLGKARLVFESMMHRDVVSWTSIITGYALHGQSGPALELFSKMTWEGVQPNQVTLSCLLSACHHKGLVHDGIRYFVCLHLDYEIPALVEHYHWVIALLGRAGQLNRAEELVQSMPLDAKAFAWRMLLTVAEACGDSQRVVRIARHISCSVDGQDPLAFVSISKCLQAKP